MGNVNQIKGSRRVCSWLVLVKNEDRLRNELERILRKENNQGKGKKKEEIKKQRNVGEKKGKGKGGKTIKKIGEHIERIQNNDIRGKEKHGGKEYWKETNAEGKNTH